MPDLDAEVFGRITIKEIIGASPPASETRRRLKEELAVLLGSLESAADPAGLLEEQAGRAKLVNGRPGAMALAQDKIRLFNEYHGMYVTEIRGRLGAGSRDAGPKLDD